MDTSTLGDGVHRLTATVTDLAGHTSSDTWAFRIDRTAPGIVPLFDTHFDADTGRTLVTWLPPEGPPLAGGTEPGSRVAVYRYRYALNGGPWVVGPNGDQWQSTTNTFFIIGGTASTDSVSMEVQAIDAAGNQGPVSTATLGVFRQGEFDPNIDDDTLDGDSSTTAIQASAVPNSAYRIYKQYHCDNGQDFNLRVGYHNVDTGKGFGYEHIKYRRNGFSDELDGGIKVTLCDPDLVKKEGTGSGSSYTYYKLDAVRHGNWFTGYTYDSYRVVYSRLQTRYDGHSKGIITAYVDHQKDPFIPEVP